MSFSPILHQVCTSDFIKDSWIALLTAITSQNTPLDWSGNIVSQFQLLSVLCELANVTIDDAVRRFLERPFVSLQVVPKISFDDQLAAAINQCIESTIIYFGLLIDIIHLFTQVDQPYTGVSSPGLVPNFNAKLIKNYLTNESSNQQSAS
ncbi:unnamed protein product, partial [Rotaria sp. Silwood1]